MALNKITFNRGKGGLGAPLPNKDHVSALVFYNDSTLPSGFSATDRVKKVFSLEAAEDLGILEAGNHSVEWYHIREYFEKQPKGELYIAIYAIPGTPASHDFAEIETVQNFAEGVIRQMGIYYPHTAFATALVTAIQAQATTMESEDKPLSIILGPDVSGTSDLTGLPDLTTLSAKNVSVTIGQDGNAKGKALYTAKSYSITDLGAKLGAVSAAAVNVNISFIESFPMVTDGFEFDTVAFANGDLFKDTTKTDISAIDNLGYLFLLRHQGITNVYNNDSYTAIAQTSDYFSIERNRTIDKAIRDIRTFTLPKLGSPLLTDSEGKLTPDTIGVFQSLAEKALENMEAAGEVSSFAVTINPDQDVVTSNKITIAVSIVPAGVAREIVFNIGFTTNLG